jgi:hypothetical protein
MKNAYGFRSFRATEVALFHKLGALPEFELVALSGPCSLLVPLPPSMANVLPDRTLCTWKLLPPLLPANGSFDSCPIMS